MSAAATVSAIVVSYHTGPRLHECLYALKSDPEVSEIIVVDNGNLPDAAAWLDAFAARTDKARVIRSGDNPGFGTAVNRGAEGALGAFLLVINPDAVIRRGSIGPLLAAIVGDADPVLVGGRIFDIRGREERGCRRNTLTIWRALGFGKWTLESDPAPAGPIQVGAVSGAFFLMNKTAFRQMGGFDEAYFLHVEDVDLCRRVIAAGGQVIYQPLAGALHYGSTSNAPSGIVKAHKAKSLARYFRKFSEGPADTIVASLATPLIAIALKLRG